MVNSLYRNAPYLLWGKHRILACDGSTIILPASKNIAADFEPAGFGPDATVERSVAKISLVFDVLNLVTLHGKIDTFKM